MEGRSFKELDIWKKGRILRNELFEIAKSFPKDEKYKLADQVIRSSRSVCPNIAEGHGRYHFQENIQFCRIARGSLSETLDHLICAFDCGYINDSTLDKFQKEVDEISKMINGYINYLNKRKMSA